MLIFDLNWKQLYELIIFPLSKNIYFLLLSAITSSTFSPQTVLSAYRSPSPLKGTSAPQRNGY